MIKNWINNTNKSIHTLVVTLNNRLQNTFKTHILYISENFGPALEKPFLGWITFCIILINLAVQRNLGFLLFCFCFIYGTMPCLYSNYQETTLQIILCWYTVFVIFVIFVTLSTWCIFRLPWMREYFYSKLGREWIT